jgi:intracellular septation protein
MKFLFDFFPILLFFLAYKLGDIYVATIAAMLSSLALVLWGRIRVGHFEKMPLITLVTLVVLGSATLIFRNEAFIKWKPTVIYWLLGLGFLLSQWIGSKPAIQRIAEQGIQLNAIAWSRLNLSWVFFFIGMGCLNIYVMQNFDTDTWVNFKLFGSMGLTFLFVLGQSVYMIRHRINVEETNS